MFQSSVLIFWFTRAVYSVFSQWTHYFGSSCIYFVNVLRVLYASGSVTGHMCKLLAA